MVLKYSVAGVLNKENVQYTSLLFYIQKRRDYGQMTKMHSIAFENLIHTVSEVKTFDGGGLSVIAGWACGLLHRNKDLPFEFQ